MLAGTADFTTNLMIYDLCGYLVKTRKTLTDCVDCKSAIQCEELDLPESFVADKYTAMRNRGGLTFVTTPFLHTMCAFEEVIASHFKDLNHIYIVKNQNNLFFIIFLIFPYPLFLRNINFLYAPLFYVISSLDVLQTDLPFKRFNLIFL
ncbi:Uncharacterized protein APZ42_006766 [Daphnia magna]|uniref:Uncharacterized protein n=1 Tax=Daphnia magna TaxID=35525 RepID=A0A164FPY5_9CRUS|nr:Uncharacterized protein APZ42_006766 [Daphnia magna]